MKKLFLLMCLMATTTIVSATDLWEGTHAVNWDNTLTIEAASFIVTEACCLVHVTRITSMPIRVQWRYSSLQACLPV